MVYLFVGQDILSKDQRLHRLKSELLNPEVAAFNFDVLYAKDITLKSLQEKLRFLPIKSQQRIVVIKGAGDLKEDIKNFLIAQAKQMPKEIVLVLDIDRQYPSRDFIKSLTAYARVYRFREEEAIDTFALSRCIEAKKTAGSLKILKALLRNGERPERILGGLRVAFERSCDNRASLKKALQLLLDCDIAIKRGLLNPVFALERLIVTVCTSTNLSRAGRDY